MTQLVNFVLTFLFFNALQIRAEALHLFLSLVAALKVFDQVDLVLNLCSNNTVGASLKGLIWSPAVILFVVLLQIRNQGREDGGRGGGRAEGGEVVEGGEDGRAALARRESSAVDHREDDQDLVRREVHLLPSSG